MEARGLVTTYGEVRALAGARRAVGRGCAGRVAWTAGILAALMPLSIQRHRAGAAE